MDHVNDNFSQILRKHLPEYLVQFLKICGYNSAFTIKSLNKDSLNEIEKFVSERSSLFNNVTLPNSYDLENFKFPPGHRLLLLNLPNFIKDENTTKDIVLPNLLDLFLKCAKQNFGKNSHQNRYHDTIKYFSIYVYLMAGKGCYETISSNLPMPQVTTISKHLQYFLFLFELK